MADFLFPFRFHRLRKYGGINLISDDKFDGSFFVFYWTIIAIQLFGQNPLQFHFIPKHFCGSNFETK